MKKKLFLSIIIFIFCVCIYGICINNAEKNDNNERVYSLSLIWREMSYNFAFPDILKEVNLDSLYLSYIQKVTQAKNDYEYLQILRSFMAHFKQGHTDIIDSSHKISDFAPVSVAYVGGKIIIIDVPECLKAELPKRSEIQTVNNIPIDLYIEKHVLPYISASTPNARYNRAVHWLFYGKSKSKIKIGIKTPDNTEKEVVIPCNFFEEKEKWGTFNIYPSETIEISVIEENIGYIKLPAFDSELINSINAVFDKNLPLLHECKGIIIDVRKNGGGSSNTYKHILDHFMLKNSWTDKGKWLTRINIATYKRLGANYDIYKGYYEGTEMMEIKYKYTNECDDSFKLRQPLVILSGHATASAAESFLNILKESERAIIIGEASAGCMDEFTSLMLSKGIIASYSSKKYVDSKGISLNTTGIMPDMNISFNYDSYIECRDNVLEKGIEELEKLIKKNNINTMNVSAGENIFTIIPDKLITTYKKELPYLPNMQGQADIITEDISLLERFILPVMKILFNNSTAASPPPKSTALRSCRPMLS